jgi:transcriptional regulator with XRE-family HTH domain
MNALTEARQTAGLTQYQLADRLGVDQSYVSKYESCRRRLDVIEFLRVVAAIGVKPEVILARLSQS